MKTPLTAIQFIERELRECANTTSDGRSDTLGLLDSLAEECTLMEGSLSMMLHTARLDVFEFNARFEEFDVLTALREVVNTNKRAWIRRSSYPRIECACTTVKVETDRKWFRFMADQIARNALQYGCRETLHEE